MSFGFGDAITAADIVWQVFKACKQAPEKIEDACKRARDIRDGMRVQQQIVETEVAHQSFPLLQKDIKRHLASLRLNLRDLRHLVEKWRDSNLFQRGIFIPRHLPDVERLAVELSYYSDLISHDFVSLGVMMQQTQPNQKTQEVENKRADAERQSTAKKQALEKDLHKEKDLLDAFLKEVGNEKLTAAAVNDDDTQWKGLQENFLQAHPSLRGSETFVTIAKLREELRSGIKDKPEEPISYKGGRWPDFEQILCVDERGDAASIIALIALESIKLWEVSAKNHWIFNRVEAAGYNVASKLSESAVAAKAYDRNLDPAGTTIPPKTVNGVRAAVKKPWEALNTIMERTENTKRQGIASRHFADFEHILCFDDTALKALQALRAFAQRQLHPSAPPLKSKITKLELKAHDRLLCVEDPRRAYYAVQYLIRGFLNTEVKWEKPIGELKYRTKQLLIDYQRREAVLQNTDRIKKMTGCVRLRTHWQSPSEGWLVTIVGPRDALKWAEALVRAA